MAKLNWFGGDDVDHLIARGKLERAIQLLEEQLRHDPRDIVCRQHLGDILGRAGHQRRAITVLAPLIERFTREGFAAKAIAVIKKLERLDPEHVDTSYLIARVRKKSENTTTVPLISAHLEPDTVLQNPFDDQDPHTETSEIDANWLENIESRHPTFSWSPLLDNLPAEIFDAVVNSLILLVKNPGAIIFGQGETATSVFVLASGFARAYRRSGSDRYRQIRVFKEGQFFGEEALLEPDARRPITVTAASECDLLEIDLASLEEIIRADPTARDHIERAYGRRAWVRQRAPA